MKIAIIAPGFTGATLPLAQHLQKMGNQVTCFYLVETGSRMMESLDFEKPLSISKLIITIPSENRVYKYLDKTIAIKIVPSYRKRHTLSKILIGKIPSIINSIRIQRFCQYIERHNFDVINLVHHNDLTLQIYDYFKKNEIKFCVSYHEVIENLISPKARKDIKRILEGQQHIIVHSNKTKGDLVKFYGIDSNDDRFHTFYFGPFESYWQYNEDKVDLHLPSNYLLFLGRITPYKGLINLYNAVKLIEGQGVNTVVAGSGKDVVLEKMKKDKNFFIINRYIKNEELCYLVRNCKAIICPYEAASQSGLVQTAFAFKKPIIATDVGAFPEVINNKNGRIVKRGNIMDLSKAIIELMGADIEIETPNYLEWDYIAMQYMNVFNLVINENS